MSVSRSPSPLHFAMLTHPGRARGGNEDACAASPEAGAYVVCDGMGGAAAGEVASRLAVDTFLDRIELPSTAPANSPAGKPQTRLHAAILAANSAVLQHAGQSAELSGMGTTLIALLYVPAPAKDRRSVPRPGSRSLPPPTLFLANVGDSRCYRRRSGALLQLSTDHSFVEEQVRAGQITADQAAVSPMRNYITRAIGSQPHVEPDIQSYRPKAGDLYLLTSDGLTRELENSEIASILDACIPETPKPATRDPETRKPETRKPETREPEIQRLETQGTETEGPETGSATRQDLENACLALIDAANAKGGRDNITVLLLLFA